jgi:uncharacterized protein
LTPPGPRGTLTPANSNRLMALPKYLTPHAHGVYLAVKLQPRSSCNALGEPLGEELRIKVTAPPVDAAANQALLRFLAEQLNCPRGAVQLVRGLTSRHKLVSIAGLSAEEVCARLQLT